MPQTHNQLRTSSNAAWKISSSLTSKLQRLPLHQLHFFPLLFARKNLFLVVFVSCVGYPKKSPQLNQPLTARKPLLNHSLNPLWSYRNKHWSHRKQPQNSHFLSTLKPTTKPLTSSSLSTNVSLPVGMSKTVCTALFSIDLFC